MHETGEIFTLFFVTFGPLKVLAPFAQRTRLLPEETMHQVAWWAFVVATVAAAAGGLVGEGLMGKWQVSLPALTLAGGVIFFLIAIRRLMEQYDAKADQAAESLPSAPFAAACRLVFPTVLPPYGIAAVIALLASANDSQEQTMRVIGVLVLIMVLDLLAMWFARRILVGFVPIMLQVLGAVLAVMQVALSVQFILRGLQSLHVISA